MLKNVCFCCVNKYFKFYLVDLCCIVYICKHKITSVLLFIVTN